MVWIIVGLLVLFFITLFGCAMWLSGLFLGDSQTKWLGVATIIVGAIGIACVSIYGVFIY